MATEGPFLTAALLCTHVLEEKDGTISLIKIADKLTLDIPDDLPADVKPIIPVKLFVALKSGDFIGDVEVSFALTSPSGKHKVLKEVFPMKLPGGEKGMNLIVNLTLGIESEGLYWVDVIVGGIRKTRIPLTTVFRRHPNPNATIQQTEK